MIRQQVQFKLINNKTGSTLKLSWQDDLDANKPAPKNWESIERRLQRSEQTFGVMTELSRDVEFTKDGAAFLRNAWIADGIEADVTMEEYRQHPTEDEFYLNTTGLFDFSKYSEEENTVKVPFKSGGLISLIKSQMSEKFQLEREESINGVTLDELNKIIVALTSRQILLISDLETPPDRELLVGNGWVSGAVCPNLEVISNSDRENVVPSFHPNEFYWLNNGETNETTADIAQLFYFNSETAKTITVRIRFRIRGRKAGMDTMNYQARIYRYNYSGSVLNYVDATTLINTGYQSSLEWVEYDAETELELNVGDSLRFGILFQAGNGTITSSALVLNIDYIEVKITEDSIWEDSNTPALFMHDIGQRLLSIITGANNKYYSEFYGRTDLGYATTGEYALTSLALGLWIRGFNNENIEISLKHFLETCNTIHATGYTVDVQDGEEKLIHEDLKYFFQEFTGIEITEQVSNVKRTAATNLHWANALFGYKEGGDYEEAMGLDEFNTQSGWTFPITRVDKKYEKISPARADSYGKEFARRKPKLNYPEEDTRYDKSLFLLDCKQGEGEAYVERTWADDYDELPTGVYSPQTATGLRLTPFRLMQRHQWFFNSALYRYITKKVRFSNSLGNTDLKTKLATEAEAQQENTSVLINDLEQNRFVGEWVEFDYPVSYELLQQINGKTVNVDGRLVANYYGKVKFINENYQTEYGYLFKVSQNKEGQWKLLKANF